MHLRMQLAHLIMHSTAAFPALYLAIAYAE